MIRDYDIACRFGGEEFLILLPHTKPDNAFELAERLRESVSKNLFCTPTKNLKITASFGVSTLPDLQDPPKQLTEEFLNINMENLVNKADTSYIKLKKREETGFSQVLKVNNKYCRIYKPKFYSDYHLLIKKSMVDQ